MNETCTAPLQLADGPLPCDKTPDHESCHAHTIHYDGYNVVYEWPNDELVTSLSPVKVNELLDAVRDAWIDLASGNMAHFAKSAKYNKALLAYSEYVGDTPTMNEILMVTNQFSIL